MLRIAAQRVQKQGLSTVDLRLLEAENLGALQHEGLFDGVFSNFAPLNCVEDLDGVAQNLGRLLKPGGTALLCFLGPSCVWEVLWYLLKGKPHKAFRRWQPTGVTAQLAPDTSVRVRYYGIRKLTRIFAPGMQLRSWKGIGLVVPPSYAEDAASRFPALLKMAEWTDQVLGSCPGLRGFSDHILLSFKRIQ
jgi:SAM-dependent methyltransferase